MKGTRIGVASAILTVLCVACTHDTMRSGSAAGELPTDSMPPFPNGVVLRVENANATRVHVYVEANEDTNEVANVAPGATQTVAIDQRYLRYAYTTFEVWPDSGGRPARLGDFQLAKGDRVRIVVAPNLDSSHVYQHGNW